MYVHLVMTQIQKRLSNKKKIVTDTVLIFHLARAIELGEMCSPIYGNTTFSHSEFPLLNRLEQFVWYILGIDFKKSKFLVGIMLYC